MSPQAPATLNVETGIADDEGFQVIQKGYKKGKP